MSKNNHVELTGNIGAAPQLVETEKAKFYAFPLYTNDSYIDKETGEITRSELSQIHDVIVFDDSKAFQIVSRLQSGDFINLEGKVTYRNASYKTEGADGNLRDVQVKLANIRPYSNGIELIQAKN